MLDRYIVTFLFLLLYSACLDIMRRLYFSFFTCVCYSMSLLIWHNKL